MIDLEPPPNLPRKSTSQLVLTWRADPGVGEDRAHDIL